MSRLSAIFEQSAKRRVALGVVLLAVGLLLIGFTEHADRLRVMAEDALGGFVLTGAAARPGPAADGQLVLAVGAPKVIAPAEDVQFGVAANAPALVRTVQMFQWQQTDFGGQLGYQMDWYDHPIDSTRFAKPAGHTNPGVFPLAGARFDSPDVTVAGFRLAPELVAKIDGVEPFKPDFRRLAPNMAASFQVAGDALVTSGDAARPRIGDLRVGWMQIDPPHLTILARDAHGTLIPTAGPSGNAVAHVMIGRLALTDVVADAPRAPHLKWARRVLALLLGWGGVALLLPAAQRRLRGQALAIAVVPLALVAADDWFGPRTWLGVILIAIAVAAALSAAWRWWRLRAQA
ncbi:MAG TPA: TMEM43 family protein [Rhodanobacteraceae bacterium]|nr:TMEM43 family protein [Rhodanobacteraceae bacterium]